MNRPEKNFEFQPRPDFLVTTPRSLQQPSSTFDSKEVEYEYEYVYDGNYLIVHFLVYNDSFKTLFKCLHSI